LTTPKWTKQRDYVELSVNVLNFKLKKLEGFNMTYLIKPYESIGNFSFGTSLEEMQKEYGKPAKIVEDNIMNNKIEYRNVCELVYENDKLVYGYCLKDSNPMLGDIDIFKNSIEDLKAIDSDFIEGKKYILFKNLGVCIGGMTGKKIPEGKLLITFDKNHLDFFENFVEV